MFQEQSAMPIRPPSTANLLIDSLDRNDVFNTQSTDFTITKQSNILSGYFTRLGMVEIVLNYSIPNISSAYKSNTLSITIGEDTQIITIPDGNYTVQSLMTEILALLNVGTDATPSDPANNVFPNVDFVFSGSNGRLVFGAIDDNTGDPVNFMINDTILSRMLGVQIGIDTVLYDIDKPYLIPSQLRYLDFVCTNITYQQGLKDASTSNTTRDILYRFNLGYDSPPALDGDGYPINQGYLPFVQRRYLNFPKMVKWDTQQPIGQLSLQVYDANGKIINVQTQADINPVYGNLEYSIGLLVSEQ
jgi:hypothetical protein